MILPDGLERVRTTPTFDESTVPAGLLAVAGDRQVIPPGRLHHVALDGPVTSAVEFFR